MWTVLLRQFFSIGAEQNFVKMTTYSFMENEHPQIILGGYTRLVGVLYTGKRRPGPLNNNDV